MVTVKKKRKQAGLTTKIFFALLAGIITGVIMYYFVPPSYVRDTVFVDGIFHFIGNGFIRGMQMLVVPLVFASLVTGTMSIGDTKKLGKIGVRTVAFYMLTTALAIAIALGLASLLRPGMGMNLVQNAEQAADAAANAAASADVSIVQTLLEIIPKNPVASLAEGNMLQIIFIAIIVGILMAKMGERATSMANLFTELNDLMMDMTMLVMKVAPFGVFCLVAKTFSGIGFEVLFSMLLYVGGVIGSLIIQCLFVYMGILQLVGGINPFIFLKKFLPVMGFAFSTASSNATVPLSINTLKEMGVSKQVSSFTVPLGATINMDGTAIMQGVAVVFVANAYNIPLTAVDYLTVIATATLASVGTAGIPSVGLVTLSMVFNSVGLPVEGIAMIMGIDRILDMARTAINVTGDAAITAIMAKKNDMFDKERFLQRKAKATDAS
ncbi:MAG: dicarboxylate/amino acid:cation symporter [Eubacteriales bacterium]|nr:dicarboxylate/amino acid:cation symporter [Eubacteriales bacterium]